MTITPSTSFNNSSTFPTQQLPSHFSDIKKQRPPKPPHMHSLPFPKPSPSTQLSRHLPSNMSPSFQRVKHPLTLTQQLLLKIIELNPLKENGYIQLAETLNPEESILLFENKPYTKKQLYLTAIELSPLQSTAYAHLANILQQDESESGSS
ncbi:MAG: hypothetical protein QRY72_01630 [Candidatus Rhabdochlamydia sp.]